MASVRRDAVAPSGASASVQRGGPTNDDLRLGHRASTDGDRDHDVAQVHDPEPTTIPSTRVTRASVDGVGPPEHHGARLQ